MKLRSLKRNDELANMINAKAMKISWGFLMISLFICYIYEYIQYGKVSFILGFLFPVNICIFSISQLYYQYFYTADEHGKSEFVNYKIIIVGTVIAIILIGIITCFVIQN